MSRADKQRDAEEGGTVNPDAPAAASSSVQEVEFPELEALCRYSLLSTCAYSSDNGEVAKVLEKHPSSGMISESHVLAVLERALETGDKQVVEALVRASLQAADGTASGTEAGRNEPTEIVLAFSGPDDLSYYEPNAIYPVVCSVAKIAELAGQSGAGLEESIKACKDATVHGSFLQAFTKLVHAPVEGRNSIAVEVKQLAREHKITKITCVGHGMGGVFATICAYWFKNFQQEFSSFTVSCVTFGAPRMGNGAFASAFQTNDASKRGRSVKLLRVVHKADPFPHFPLGVDGTFADVGRGVFLYEPQSNTVALPQDPWSSNRTTERVPLGAPEMPGKEGYVALYMDPPAPAFKDCPPADLMDRPGVMLAFEAANNRPLEYLKALEQAAQAAKAAGPPADQKAHLRGLPANKKIQLQAPPTDQEANLQDLLRDLEELTPANRRWWAVTTDETHATRSHFLPEAEVKLVDTANMWKLLKYGAWSAAAYAAHVGDDKTKEKEMEKSAREILEEWVHGKKPLPWAPGNLEGPPESMGALIPESLRLVHCSGPIEGGTILGIIPWQTDTQALLGFVDLGGNAVELVVAVRGTEGPTAVRDWCTNLSAFMTPLSELVKDDPEKPWHDERWRVHVGFVNAANDLVAPDQPPKRGLAPVMSNSDKGSGKAYPGGLAAMVAELEKDLLKPKGKQITKVTACGHSLGGAVAKLVAYWCRKNRTPEWQWKGAEVECYSYGAPTALSEELAKHWCEAIPTAWRVVHRKDAVPYVPASLFGWNRTPYQHVETSVLVCQPRLEPFQPKQPVKFQQPAKEDDYQAQLRPRPMLDGWSLIPVLFDLAFPSRKGSLIGDHMIVPLEPTQSSYLSALTQIMTQQGANGQPPRSRL